MNIKKIIALMLVFAFIFAICGCGKKNVETPPPVDPPTEVSSTAPLLR